jgi:hypothetical protein
MSVGISSNLVLSYSQTLEASNNQGLQRPTKKQTTEKPDFTHINPKAFKTPTVTTKEEVYVAADEVLTHPYFTPIHASIYGTVAGAKAGLLISPLVIAATYAQEAIFKNQFFGFPFQGKLKNLPNPLKQMATMAGITLYTTGLSALMFGGIVGLLIQANAQIKIAQIRRAIYNEHSKQNNSIAEDKLVGHFVHQQAKEDPITAYKNWSSDLASPKDAAVNGILSASVAKLVTLVPKLLIGILVGIGAGAYQAWAEFQSLRYDEQVKIPVLDMDTFHKIVNGSPQLSSTIIKNQTAIEESISKGYKAAKEGKVLDFLQERFCRQPAMVYLKHTLHHLAAPAFWMSFLVVPSLVAIQLTDLFKNKIGIDPPNHYQHFHLANWLERWRYAKERAWTLQAGSVQHPTPTTTAPEEKNT